MTEKIYYEDNLYYLNEVIQTIHNGIQLEIDTDIFLDKIVEDIMFVESSLSIMYNSLKENNHLIKRSELFRKLMRTKSRFAELLETVTTEETPISSHLAPFGSKFAELRTEQEAHVTELQVLLSAAAAVPTEVRDTVSQEEYRFLLMAENSDDIPQ